MIIKFEIAVGLILVASVMQLAASYEELPAALRENLDPVVDVIVETTDLTRGDPWSRDDVTRSGNEFRAGTESDLLHRHPTG